MSGGVSCVDQWSDVPDKSIRCTVKLNDCVVSWVCEV